jgi:hypothetical protein
MNIDDLEKAVKKLDAIGPGARVDPIIDKAIEKLRKQIVRRGKKELYDDLTLENLADLIEIHGMSQKQAFKAVGQYKGFSVSRAQKLWFDTQNHTPEKIEDLRQRHAYRLLSDFLTWMNGDQAEAFSSPGTLIRLKNKEPELYEWAKTITFLDFHDVKHRDFKPRYKKPVEVLEKDLLSIQKEIASSD